MESLTLREILASLMKEFETAGVSADVSREHWRQVYESNALLKEFSPSRIRITEASVSLPLAFTRVAKPKPQVPYLTGTQLLRLLPPSIPLDQRARLADDVAGFVTRSKRMSFVNKRLVRAVRDDLERRLREPGAAPAVDAKELDALEDGLERLRAEFLSRVNANPEREAHFAYQTEELAKLAPDRIVRFDIKLALD